MTTLAVIGALLVVLVLACRREARSGRREWGSSLDGDRTRSQADRVPAVGPFPDFPNA